MLGWYKNEFLVETILLCAEKNRLILPKKNDLASVWIDSCLLSRLIFEIVFVKFVIFFALTQDMISNQDINPETKLSIMKKP